MKFEYNPISDECFRRSETDGKIRDDLPGLSDFASIENFLTELRNFEVQSRKRKFVVI